MTNTQRTSNPVSGIKKARKVLCLLLSFLLCVSSIPTAHAADLLTSDPALQQRPVKTADTTTSTASTTTSDPLKFTDPNTALSAPATDQTVTTSTSKDTTTNLSFQVSLSQRIRTQTPTVTPINIKMSEDATATIQLNGTDPKGGTLTYTLLSNPLNGTLVKNTDLINAQPTYTYTPNANYNGTDSFVYNVCTASKTCTKNTAAITIAPVNDMPTVTPVSVNGTEDTAATILLNGQDPDGDALTYTIFAKPLHGTLVKNPATANPEYFYTPDGNYNGGDSFIYMVCDSTSTCTQNTVSVSLAAVNDVPTVTPIEIKGTEDTRSTILLTGQDPDGDKITYTISQPLHGTLTRNQGTTKPEYFYTPTANYNGSDSFTYKICDASACTQNTVSISLAAVNDVPTVSPISIKTNSDTLATFLLNGRDPDGGLVSYSILSTPLYGRLVKNPFSFNPPEYSYTPASGFAGADSFTYQVCDSAKACTQNTVAITVVATIAPLQAKAQDLFKITDALVQTRISELKISLDNLTKQLTDSAADDQDIQTLFGQIKTSSDTLKKIAADHPEIDFSDLITASDALLAALAGSGGTASSYSQWNLWRDSVVQLISSKNNEIAQNESGMARMKTHLNNILASTDAKAIEAMLAEMTALAGTLPIKPISTFSATPTKPDAADVMNWMHLMEVKMDNTIKEANVRLLPTVTGNAVIDSISTYLFNEMKAGTLDSNFDFDKNGVIDLKDLDLLATLPSRLATMSDTDVLANFKKIEDGVFTMAAKLMGTNVGGTSNAMFDADGTGKIEFNDLKKIMEAYTANHALKPILINITDKLATPDDATDDRGAISSAIWAAKSTTKRGIVICPPGLYWIGTNPAKPNGTEITLYEGVSLFGYGATFKRMASQPNNSMIANDYTLQYAQDTRPIVVKGLTVDGNRSEQYGMYYIDADHPELGKEYKLGTRWDLEHQNNISFSIESSTSMRNAKGHLVVDIQDVTLNAAGSDGIMLTKNIIANIENVTAGDNWRASLSFNGGNSYIDVKNFTSTADLGVVSSVLAIEVPDGGGYGYRDPVTGDGQDVHLTIDGFTSKAFSYMSLLQHSTAFIKNLNTTGAFYIGGNQSRVVFQDSYFGVLPQAILGGTLNKTRNPGYLEFNHVVFEAINPTGYVNPAGKNSYYLFTTGYDLATKDSKVIFTNGTVFKTGVGVLDTDGVNAYGMGGDPNAPPDIYLNNQTIFEDSRIEGFIDTAANMTTGGILRMRDTYIGSGIGVRTAAKFTFMIDVSNVTYGAATKPWDHLGWIDMSIVTQGDATTRYQYGLASLIEKNYCAAGACSDSALAYDLDANGKVDSKDVVRALRVAMWQGDVDFVPYSTKIVNLVKTSFTSGAIPVDKQFMDVDKNGRIDANDALLIENGLKEIHNQQNVGIALNKLLATMPSTIKSKFDLNGDGTVNYKDLYTLLQMARTADGKTVIDNAIYFTKLKDSLLALLATYKGKTAATTGYVAEFDVNHDGIIDANDLNMLAAAFNYSGVLPW